MEEIIDYVNQYTNHYRTSPSTREIAKAVKTDNGTVYRYLVEMNEKPRFYVSTSKSIIKALINMRSFEIQLSPIG